MPPQNPKQPTQISVFLDRGMDVNVRDQHGNTPLHLSLSGVSTTTLIQGGADIIALNDAGKTAQRIFLNRLAVETRKSGANNNAINTRRLNFYRLAIHDSIIKEPKPTVILRRLDKILTPELKQKLETNSIMEPVYEQMDYLRPQEKSKKPTKVADKVRSKVRFQKQLSQTAVPGNASEVKKAKM